MIISDNIKSITLYKLDRLVREIIVSLYLQKGSTDQCLNEMDENVEKVLNIAYKIKKHQDINFDDLKYIELQYQVFQPMIDSVNDLKTEFQF